MSWSIKMIGQSLSSLDHDDNHHLFDPPKLIGEQQNSDEIQHKNENYGQKLLSTSSLSLQLSSVDHLSRKFKKHSIIISIFLFLMIIIFLFNNFYLGSNSKILVSASPNVETNNPRDWIANLNQKEINSKHQQKQKFSIKPFLRITLNNNTIEDNSKKYSIEMILPLPLLSSLPNVMTESSLLNLYLTANILELDGNTSPSIINQQSNSSKSNSFDNNIKFWSSNFVYAKQLLEDNNDFHETIELKNTNQSEYYSNHLIENLLNKSSSSSSKTTSSNLSSATLSNDNKLCQLFTGFTAKLNDNSSIQATITICNDGTMNGLITLDHYGHIILENAQQHCRIETRIEQNNSTILIEVCPHFLSFVAFPEINTTTKEHKIRRKRSYSSERTIEILVVTDLSMYVYHENSLRNYVFTLMAMVSHLFKHSSIGNEINIKLIKLISLLDEQQEKNWFGSAHKTLRHFCHWQYEHNHPSDEHPLHYDTAILLTKIDLCSKNEIDFNEIDGNSFRPKTRSSCDTLGLAHSGQICDPESSCAIVEDNGLSAAFTIAHELGHLLGVPHDDEEQCKKYYAQTETPRRQEFNVMVRMIDSTSHMWSWSSCSKHFITEFLDSGHGDCLLDNNSVDIRQSSEARAYDTYQRRSFIDKLAKLPAGALYSADEQCRLVFDKNSSICLDMPYCKKLWCTSNNIGGCRTQHMPWADGTECGNGFWCQEGECVRINRASRHPIDGKWGEWSTWSECSLNCGGGIRRSKRECNNPSPKYGGKFCLGERVKYESCNLEPCPYQSTNDDPRAKQCSEFNRYNMTWLPKYTGVSSSDLCALYCESSTGESHKFKSRVVDGTPCSPDSYDICVNGKCLSAGCDRILGSNVHADYCGVCGGDNSTCREISGQFKPRLVPHGYTFVLSIPPGATNVEIVKEPSAASDNWLALRGEYGDYLLNGHFTVNVYERKWYYGGTTVDYSGTKRQGFERINISRPIRNPLHLEVLCVGELRVPIINYRFVVTSDNAYVNYQWISEPEWSQCNKACNGEQERKPFCVAIIRPSWLMDNSQPMIREIQVNDEYCGIQTRPATEYRVCNTHCELEWHIYQTSPCSTKCGHGSRTRQINCTQTFINHSERIYIDDFYCFHLGPKPPDKENCTGDDCRVSYQWQYSEWSACVLHQTCGTGQQNRIAHCISTTYLDSDPLNVIHSNVGQELCIQHLSEPIIVQSCQVECPRWNAQPWSECSGNCGLSERTRRVTCMHSDQLVVDAYCETLEAKPIERISCELPNCLPIDPISNFYQLDNIQNHNRSKIHHQEVSLFNSEESIMNNEMDFHNPHYLGIWQSGEWSSCNTLFKHIKFLNRFGNHFQTPKCFDSIDQINSFREQFVHLFKLNESLHSNSRAELASLLNLNESNLIRRRYVACVLPNSQHVLPDTKCNPKNRPKSEENCPLDETVVQLMPHFNMELCPSTTTVNIISYEIESKSNNFEESYFNHYKINEEIKWSTNDWGSCFCDLEKKIFVKKRNVICVRSADGNSIRDEYCLQNQLTKPKEIEECTSSNEYFPNNKLECEPYIRQQAYQTADDFSVAQNLTTIEHILNTNRYQQSLLLPSHSHFPFFASEQLITLTPSLSTTSKSSLFSSTSSLPSIVEHVTVLPTISLQSVLDPTYSPRLPSYNTYMKSQGTLSPSYSSMNNEYESSSGQIEPSVVSNSTMITNLTSSYISKIMLPNQISQPLNGGWTEWTEWNKCSVTCGNGIQSREPRCPSGQCKQRFKPQIQYRSCYRMCGFFQWHYSEWSPCSVNCGPGFRTRNAECRDWTGFPVPSRFCENEQLIIKEQCHMIDCKLVWRSGQWSECSQSCGPGVQTRTVTCHRINKHGAIDPKPLDYSNFILRRKRKHFKSKRKTKRKKSKVSKRRNRQSIYYSQHWCNLDNKPSPTQICNLGACLQVHMADAYVWRTTDWQMCSASCGFGYQRRKVYCFSQRTNNRVDRSRCDPKLKPEKRRQCNLRSCEVISCQDRRDRARIGSDGEYELWVQGAMIRVYCFGMDFMEKPIEYLILNENTYDDNYSERTIGSNNCFRYSGHSVEMKKSTFYFKYVRFNVLTMEILANDTRFLVTQDSNSNTRSLDKFSIGYGQAFIQGCPLAGPNDHSNSINCYFGSNTRHNDPSLRSMFSINLQKTGLIIDDDQWIIIGNDYDLVHKNVQISRNGEKIIGHCNFKMDKLPIAVPSSSDCLIGCKPVDNIIKVRIP